MKLLVETTISGKVDMTSNIDPREVKRIKVEESHPSNILETIKYEEIKPQDWVKLHLSRATWTGDTVSNGVFTSSKLFGLCKMSDFDVQSCVGSGGCGTVCKAKHVPTQTPVVLKYMKESSSHEEFITHTLRHPNINLHHCTMQTNEGVLVYVFDIAPGLTVEALRARSFFKGKYDLVVNRFLKQLLDTIDYLDQRHIAHLDLKENNVMYDPKSDLLTLIDFGEADIAIDDRRTRCLSTNILAAPEILRTELKLSTFYEGPVDYYSVGIMIYRIYYNDFAPFGLSWDDSIEDQYQKKVLIQEPVFQDLERDDTKIDIIVYRLCEPDPSIRRVNILKLREFLFSNRMVDERIYFEENRISYVL